MAHLDADSLGAGPDEARFRLELLIGDRELLDLVEPILSCISSIRDAGDLPALKERETESQALLADFIAASRAVLGADPA